MAYSSAFVGCSKTPSSHSDGQSSRMSISDHLASIPNTSGLSSTMQDGSRSGQLDTPSMTNTATLFGTLSTNPLAIIVKLIYGRLGENVYEVPSMYDEPKPDRAKRCEQVRLLALLFCENSPFRAAAATLVSQIELCWPNPRTAICPVTWVLSIGPEMYESEAKETELARTLFSACGPYVRKIIMKKVPEDEEKAKDFMEQFETHVFQYCRNVEEVEFWEYRAPLTKWGTASSLFAGMLPT